MAAVRGRACVEPGKITDHPNVRPPTDVMAITSLPRCRYVVTRSRPYPIQRMRCHRIPTLLPYPFFAGPIEAPCCQVFS